MAEPKKRPGWLFMMYMVAGDNDQLDTVAIQDLLELEKGVNGNWQLQKDLLNGQPIEAQPENVQVYAQIHRRWPASPQRYFIARSSPAEPPHTTFVRQVEPGISKPSSEFASIAHRCERPVPQLIGTIEDASIVSMGRRETLTEFLLNAPDADNYCLVLWGHAFGLGFGRDHNDPIKLTELKEALGAFNDCRGKPLDLLGANTCTMSYAEAIYELRHSATYLVASEVFVPFAGWPYQQILKRVKSSTQPQDLGKLIVDEYMDFYAQPDRDERVAMSLIELNRSCDLSTKLNKVAVAVNTVIGDSEPNPDRTARVQDAFLINPAGEIRPVLDLTTLCGDLTTLCEELRSTVKAAGPTATEADVPGVEALRVAAGDLRNFLQPTLNSESPSETRGPLVFQRAHPDLAGLEGIGIFAPFVVDRSRLSLLELQTLGTTEEAIKEKDQKGKEEYSKLDIFRTAQGGNSAGSWSTLVFDRLRPERPDEIVENTGVVRPAERSAVSHMIFAVDASFRRLYRTLESSKGCLVRAVARRPSPTTMRDAAARFGPPRLRLTGGVSLQVNPARFPAPVANGGPSSTAESIVKALRCIEDTLARVEATVRRVVTDKDFGIGPAANRPGTGPAGFNKPIGQGLIDKGIGEGLGGPLVRKPIGPGLGASTITDDISARELGVKMVFLTADQQLGSVAAIELFTQIALSMQQLESDVARIEAIVAQFLLDPNFGLLLSDEDYQQAVEDSLDEAFRVLDDAALQARYNVRSVLAHPTYGLGPGPAGLGRTEREALAIAAGLGRRNLRLLPSRPTKM